MKRWMTVCAVVAVIALIAAPAFAKGPSAPAGSSNTGHLYLYAKECQDPWSVVTDGWGKMKYSLIGSTFDFVFNGHGLEPGTEYTLIYYPDPWPGNGLLCLGSGTANGGGNVHIAGSYETDTDLPAGYDANVGPDPLSCPYEQCGAKIWLILDGDVDCDNQLMTGWHCTPGGPSEYLFEEDRIWFTDTDGP